MFAGRVSHLGAGATAEPMQAGCGRVTSRTR